jgi:hypothetical protein
VKEDKKKTKKDRYKDKKPTKPVEDVKTRISLGKSYIENE